MLGLADADPATLADGLLPIADGLLPIADGYSAWLDEQTTHAATLPAHLRAVADETLSDAHLVHTQLTDGIHYLLDHDDALACFRFMNRVMADQRTHSEVVRLHAEDDTLTVAAE